MAQRIATHMGTLGTKFIHKSNPTKLEKAENGRTKVTWSQNGEEKSDEFDTVLFAIGRYAVTEGLNLANAGL